LAEFAGTLDGIAFINPHDRQGIYNLKEIVDWAEDFYLYKIANRLAAYEDTGLMPEEITELQAEVERLRLMVKSITGGLDEAIEIGDYLEAENALLRKVEEVGEIMWSEAVCHRCQARECRGCAAHDFKRALSEYQSWKEGQK